MAAPSAAVVDELKISVERLTDQLKREVNVTMVTPEEWRAAKSGFLKQVQKSPLVRVQLRPSNAT